MAPTLPMRCSYCDFDVVSTAKRELAGDEVDIEELRYEIRPTWCGLSLCSDFSGRCFDKHEFECKKCYAGAHDLREGYSFSAASRFLGKETRGYRCERCGLGFRASSVAERLPARYGCTGEAMSTPVAKGIEEHEYQANAGQANAFHIALDMLARESSEPLDEHA